MSIKIKSVYVILSMLVFLSLTGSVSAVPYTDCSELIAAGANQGKSCVPVTSCGDINSINDGNLDQINTYYLLMNNISADDSCILVNNDNIIFDLNGYTILFAENPTFMYENCQTYDRRVDGITCHNGISSLMTRSYENYGYRTPDWYWDGATPRVDNGCDNLIIKNGIIEQSNTISTFSNGLLIDCINAKAHNLTIKLLGNDNLNILSMSINNSIYNNLIVNNGTYVTNRMAYPAVIKMSSNYAKVYDNIILGGPDMGIAISSYGEVYRNVIKHNQYGENAFGIATYRGDYNKIYDNNITPFNGRGILIDGSAYHNQIYNNYIEVKESGTTRAYGLRLRYGPVNNTIWNNTIVAYAGYPGIEGHATGLILSFTGEATGNKIFNNTFKCITYNSAYNCDALGLDGLDLNSIYGNSHLNNLISDNTFIGNNRLIHTKTSPGNNVGDSFFNFINPKFIRSDEGDQTAQFDVMNLGGTDWTDTNGIYRTTWAINHTILNASFGNGASLNDIYFSSADCNSGTPCSYFIKWFLDVEVILDGSPAIGATVNIKDNLSSVVAQDVLVNGQGHLVSELIEFLNANPGGLTMHSPYNVTVTYNGDVQSRIVTVDSSKTELFSFSSGPCVDTSTRQCGVSSVGACSYGLETCSGGVWGSCVGNIDPVTEVCENGVDDDCDTFTDYDDTADCTIPTCDLPRDIYPCDFIDNGELSASISDWYSDIISISQLMTNIKVWKRA